MCFESLLEWHGGSQSCAWCVGVLPWSCFGREREVTKAMHPWGGGRRQRPDSLLLFLGPGWTCEVADGFSAPTPSGYLVGLGDCVGYPNTKGVPLVPLQPSLGESQSCATVVWCCCLLYCVLYRFRRACCVSKRLLSTRIVSPIHLISRGKRR